MSPEERYRQELTRPGFLRDPAQEAAVEALQLVYEDLCNAPRVGALRRLLSGVQGRPVAAGQGVRGH